MGRSWNPTGSRERKRGGGGETSSLRRKRCVLVQQMSAAPLKFECIPSGPQPLGPTFLPLLYTSIYRGNAEDTWVTSVFRSRSLPPWSRRSIHPKHNTAAPQQHQKSLMRCSRTSRRPSSSSLCVVRFGSRSFMAAQQQLQP